MTDIRTKVEEDRGLLKKIQLIIPGFRGYRKREDVRAADSILRLQMADGLVRVRDGLDEIRRQMTESYQMSNLDKMGSLINKTRTLEGKVRHAEQGYSGFSPTIRIEEEELNRLYEYDYRMISSIRELEEMAKRLLDATRVNDLDTMDQHLDGLREELVDFESNFEDRIPQIAGIYNL
jgi:hypothetical protein